MREGWDVQRIGDVADTRLGKTLPRGAGRVSDGQRYLRNVNVRWGRVTTDDLNTMNFSESEQRELELLAGDVLVCEGGEVGRCALIVENMPGVYFQNALHRLRSNGAVEPAFLAYAIENLVSSGGLDGVTSRVTIAHLNQTKLRDLELLIPPLPEQRRIVDLIGALDESIEAADEARSKFRNAILELGIEATVRASTGAWKTVTLAEALGVNGTIQTGPFGSQLHQHDYVDEGTAVVMPANMRDGNIVETGMSRIGEADAERLRRHRLLVGDIAWSRRGDVTRFAAIGEDQQGMICGTGCLLVRPGDPALTDWLAVWLATPVVATWLIDHSVGATMANLNTGILSNVPVALPPEGERPAFIGALAGLKASAEAAAWYSASLRTLRSNLLAALLSGDHEIPSSYDELLGVVA